MKIKPVSIQKYNLKSLSPNSSGQIAFKGIKEDILEISKTKTAEVVEGNLEEGQIKEILSSLTPENVTSENSKHILYDAQGLVAKIAKGEARDLVLPESYALSELSRGETQLTPKQIALLKLKNTAESETFKYIQIQEKTNATPIGLNSQSYTPENLRKFLSGFFDMDKKGLVNFDLSPQNLALTPKGDVRILNFGRYSLINNKGEIISSDIGKESIETLRENTKTALPERLKGTFFNFHTYSANMGKNYLYGSQNPRLYLQSNATSFEMQSLYPFLTSENSSNPLETFKEYLKAKSEAYYIPYTEYIKNISLGDTGPRIAPPQAKRNSIEYFESLIQLITDQDENFIKAEAAKMQFRKSFEVSGGKYNNEMLSAYRQLYRILCKLVNYEDTSYKCYANYNLNFFEDLYKSIGGKDCFGEGEINKNLLAVLFPDAKELAKFNKQERPTTVLENSLISTHKNSVQEAQSAIKQEAKENGNSVSNTAKEATKNAKKSKAPFVIAGLVILAGIYGLVKFMGKKARKEEKIQKEPVQETLPTNTNEATDNNSQNNTINENLTNSLKKTMSNGAFSAFA